MTKADEIHIFATIFAQPDKVDALRELLTKLVPDVRKEPGNIAYIIHEEIKTPGNFYIFEAYENQAAVDAHMSSAHLAAAGGQLGALLSAPPNFAMVKVIAE